jgi:hypothetical protein
MLSSLLQPTSPATLYILHTTTTTTDDKQNQPPASHSSPAKSQSQQAPWKNSHPHPLILATRQRFHLAITWIKAYTAGFERWFY